MPSRDTVIVILFSAIAIYFATAALWPLFPPPDVTKDGRFILLLLSVFFFIVPVADKVEIFHFLSFERRLKDADKKINQQGEEIRHLQTVQATLTNSLMNITAQTNNNTFHIHADRGEALQGIASVAAENPSHEAGSPLPTVSLPDEASSPENRSSDDPTKELIFVSIDLEIALRVSVGRNLNVFKSRREAKYLTRSQLVDMFISQYPVKEPLKPSFDYFFQVANAAGHGQIIPPADASSAVVIGQFLLHDVRQVPTLPDGSIEPAA